VQSRCFLDGDFMRSDGTCHNHHSQVWDTSDYDGFSAVFCTSDVLQYG
jgi:hypothetical protein